MNIMNPSEKPNDAPNFSQLNNTFASVCEAANRANMFGVSFANNHVSSLNYTNSNCSIFRIKMSEIQTLGIFSKLSKILKTNQVSQYK